MDVFMVKLNDFDVDEGDEVIIFDENNNAEDYARTVGTISYEILTNLSQRIERKIMIFPQKFLQPQYLHHHRI